MGTDKASRLLTIIRPNPTVDHKPLPSSGRAGRNLPAAVASAVVLIVVVAAALFLARPVFLVIVGILVWLASWEIAGALARRDMTVMLVPVYLGGAAMLVAGAYGSVGWLMISLYLTLIMIVINRMLWSSLSTRPVLDVLASVFTAVYVPFLGSFVALISAYTQSPWPLVFFIVVVVCNDLGGWMAGVLYGKHPMAPKLSPKKSWEGFAGSVALCLVAGVIGTFVMDIPWWWAVVMAVVGSVIGTLGDLTESLIKRDVGLKDMSGILPGHGGIMDRVDSILFAAPAFFLIYTLAFSW
ncbi:phosphatidate cytidylyltransferase [Actinomycetaceae bacterium MB13-C1-2]|nr:phosphatidate cytidylyltransferase [Actinomycetaceae bacterium MB13-C1-2]